MNGSSHSPNTDVKMGFLILTQRNQNHPQIWSRFFKEAGEEARIFVHAKYPSEVTDPLLIPHLIAEHLETSWGHISLVRAMMALLREALGDRSLTHFCYLSESCIPIKPWPMIRREVAQDPRSRIRMVDGCDMPRDHALRHFNTTRIPYSCWMLHSQWVLLDRRTAETIVEEDMTKRFECSFAPDEHYIGSVLALKNYPLTEINRSDLTWVSWLDGKCRSYDRIGDHLARQLAEFPGFFARKFPPSANLGNLKDLWDSRCLPSPRRRSGEKFTLFRDLDSGSVPSGL